MHLTASDPGSGVQSILYSVDGSAPSLPYQGGVAISAEGTTTLRYTAVDAAGNSAAPRTALVRIDNSAPVSSNGAPSAWSATPITAVLSAADPLSGVARTYFRLDGGATAEYVTPFEVAAEGVHSVEYWSVDAAGNTETTKTASIRIDRSAPSSTDDAPLGWQRSPLTFALHSTDSLSGVAAARYSIDGGATTVYTTGITVSGDGTRTVAYAAVDNVGNVEATRTVTVRTDASAPTVSDDAPAGWSNAPVLLSVFANDPHSGVQMTLASLDGAMMTPYTAPIPVVGEGIHSVSYSAIDNVGNSTGARLATVRIDLSAPVTTSNAVALYTTTATITLSPSDTLSGVASTEYRLDGGSWTPGTTVSTSAGGTHTLEFRSTDAVGNVELTKSVTFGVKARSEQTADGVYYKGTWTTSNNASRSGGSWAYTNAAGSFALFHFTGTGFDLIGSVAPNLGKARIVVDGTEAGYADFYLSGYVHKAKVFALTGLADSAHTVRIEWSGTKNAASSGTGIGIDALDVVGTLAPDTAAPTSSGSADGAWRMTPATITLSSEDAETWVTAIRYRVDGGAETTYTVPFTVSAQGTHSVEYWAYDAAANAETPKTLVVRNDTTAPVTQPSAPSGWVADSAEVTLSATDEHSGVASTLYSTDGSAPSLPYSGPIQLSSRRDSHRQVQLHR